MAISFTSDFAHIINGAKASSATTAAVINPATKEEIARVPIATPDQLDAAIDAAEKAFPAWAATPYAERQKIVSQMGDVLEKHQPEFLKLLTMEQGKPISTHSTWEVGGSIIWFREIAKQTLPEDVLLDNAERKVYSRHTPLGVCAGIVPWNFPILLAVWKIAPALLAGNCLIVKPSPFTPLSDLKLVEVFQQILPPGVLSILSGDDNLGPWITAHPRIKKVAFTGSSATGKLVMKSASASLKRLTLELGGNDPAIVLPDVDAAKIAPKLFWAAFQNNAQFCNATKRLYVHADVYDAVLAELVKFTKTVKVGNGLDKDTQLGPIQNKMQYAKVKTYFDDCHKNGYKFAIGGQIDESAPGYFVPVSLVDNPPESSKLVQEEPFGPILPVLKWTDEEDVIRRANDSPWGLGSSVWGKDQERCARIAKRLETGTVWVNEVHQYNPWSPFGGHKESGIGVENSVAGLLAWTNHQTLTFDKKPDL